MNEGDLEMHDNLYRISKKNPKFQKKLLDKFIKKYPLTEENFKTVVEIEAKKKVLPTKEHPNQYFRSSTELTTQYFNAYRHEHYPLVSDKKQAKQIVEDPNKFMASIRTIPNELVEAFRPVKQHYESKNRSDELFSDVFKNVYFFITCGEISGQMQKHVSVDDSVKMGVYINLYRDFVAEKDEKGKIKVKSIDDVNWNNFQKFLQNPKQQEKIQKYEIMPTQDAFNGFKNLMVNAHNQLLKQPNLQSETSQKWVSGKVPASPRDPSQQFLRSKSESNLRKKELEKILNSEVLSNLSDGASQQWVRGVKPAESSDPIQPMNERGRLLRSESTPNLSKVHSVYIKSATTLIEHTIMDLEKNLSMLSEAVKKADASSDVADSFKTIGAFFKASVRVYCQTGNVEKVDDYLGKGQKEEYDHSISAKANLENAINKLTDLIEKNPNACNSVRNVEDIVYHVNKAKEEGLIKAEGANNFNRALDNLNDNAPRKS